MRLNVHAAIGHKDAAGGIAALLRSKEKHHSRDLFGISVAPQQRGCIEGFDRIPAMTALRATSMSA
jgi:hypothetical protein